MSRSSPFRSTKTPGLNMWKHENMHREENQPVNTKTQNPENDETGENAKTWGINAKTRKRRKPENAKTAKTRIRRKRENGENPKRENAQTRKRRKHESRVCSKQQNATVNQASNQRRTEVGTTRNAKTRKNGKKCSRFLVFSFSGFLVSAAASVWPGRVFYVLSFWALLMKLHNGFHSKQQHQLQARHICCHWHCILKIGICCGRVGNSVALWTSGMVPARATGR